MNEFLERGLHTPSQCSVAPTDDIWCRGFVISNGVAKDFIYDVLLQVEVIHEDIDSDVLGEVSGGRVLISLL